MRAHRYLDVAIGLLVLRGGFLLRYVFVDGPAGQPRVFVNLELVRGGYAEAVSFEPDTARHDELEAAEREAREQRLGMWAACPIGMINR